MSADPDRIGQVISNLVSNAIKFTPSGGRIAISLRQLGEQAELAVSDTGEGIAPEFLPFVFERFRQADSSSRRSQGGLGIGLADDSVACVPGSPGGALCDEMLAAA